MTPPIIMMRAETAERSVSRPDSFLRQSMASTRKGSRSRRARSASVSVKSRGSGSGESSCSSSSSSSGMLSPFLRAFSGTPKSMLTQTYGLVERNTPTQGHHNKSIPLSADEYHGTRGWDKARSVDAVPLFLFIDDGTNVRLHVIVRCALAKKSAQVVIVLAEKAG